MLSVIILSNTIDEEIYQMNSNCISSLINSESWAEMGGLEIILVESNKNNTYNYDKNVQLIIPEDTFNFNHFFNIGIEKAKGQYIALCNNDIIFSKNWFKEILKVKEKNKQFLCFSPIDRNYHTMSYEKFPADKDYYLGWENKSYFAGWCFVVDRKIFNIIGKLDITFKFYGADDDFILNLRKYAIFNVLVTNSNVKHLSQQVTEKVEEYKAKEIIDKEKYPIPEKFLKRGYNWLWMDYKYYDGFIKLYHKWGDIKMLGRIDRFLDKYSIFRRRFITYFLYNVYIVKLLSWLTRI